MHDWHVAHGAVFEDVGQWKRPRYYPQPGEDMDAAVLRECAAVRDGVGILDGSTLGKIDVQGPDAAVFLDRLYTNLMSTLKVGSVRYGVMCGADGMVIDDGTVLRLADDRFLVSTTTGGAAAVLDWMEEWLQTEWPHLRVHCTSVTEQWATFPVVGPRSRDVIGAVFARRGRLQRRLPVHDLAGHHARRSARCGWPGSASPASWPTRSTSTPGTPWRCGSGCSRPASRYGITPYGTETMHVLRAEKGYPIIGQDTDGTVTPHDLGHGLGGVEEEDRLHRQALLRPGRQHRPDRKQLVGLLPVDRRRVLPEGSQIVEGPRTASCRRRRCRCSGTSPPATAARRWTARSPSPWSRAAAAGSARPCTCRSTATLVPVEIAGPGAGRPGRSPP